MAATASPQTRSSYPAINTLAPGDRRVLNENELAQRWGISPKTLQRWRSEGRGPKYLKLSKRVSYPLETVIEFKRDVYQMALSELARFLPRVNHHNRYLRAGMRPLVVPQPAEGVTYAHKLDKAEARLDWSQPATALANKVRAFNPWPVAEAELSGERLRIHEARAIPLAHGQPPGAVLAATREGLDVACGEGVLRIRVLQRDGGKAITAADALNGGFLKARRDLRA